MIKLFAFAVKTVLGMMTVTCGMPVEMPPPGMPPTQGQPVYYVCMMEINEGERYFATGRFFRLDKGDPGLEFEEPELPRRGDEL